MFYTIHRAIKFLLLCGALWVCWKIYERREIFEPMLIWYDVWDNGGFRAPPMPTIAGRVERVMNSQTFVLRQKKSARVNVRLMGLREPSKDLSIEAMEKEKKRKEALDELIKDRWVHVDVSYENLNNVGGFVWARGTNVNAYLVRHGLASTSKELVKGLPKEMQYQMLWAQRHRATNEVASR